MASMSIHAGAGAGIEGWKVSTAYRSLTAQQHYWLETHIICRHPSDQASEDVPNKGNRT